MSDLVRRVSHSGNSPQAKSFQVNGHTNTFYISLFYFHFGAWSTDSIYAKFPIQILIFVQFFCLTFFFFFFMLFREIPQGVNF